MTQKLYILLFSPAKPFTTAQVAQKAPPNSEIVTAIFTTAQVAYNSRKQTD